MKPTKNSSRLKAVEFGLMLKRFRLGRRMSEDEIGLLLGISGNNIYMMERGKLAPAKSIRERFETLSEAADLYAVAACSSNRERDAAVIAWAQAACATSFDEIPLHWLENARSACPDQQAFGIRLVGDSMEPYYRAGQVVVVMPNCVPRHGCLVVARLLTEGVMFKRFTLCKSRPQQFKLCSYNRKYPPVQLSWDEVQWVYPVFSAKGQATRPSRAAGG